MRLIFYNKLSSTIMSHVLKQLVHLTRDGIFSIGNSSSKSGIERFYWMNPCCDTLMFLPASPPGHPGLNPVSEFQLRASRFILCLHRNFTLILSLHIAVSHATKPLKTQISRAVVVTCHAIIDLIISMQLLY
jgi:hypothetical protein